MDIYDLTTTQLRRAAAIKEQIEGLNKELQNILGAPTTSGTTPKKKRTMSASAKKKIAAAQRARWASLRSARPAKLKKKAFSTATRAKLSAKLKAYWAAKKKKRK